MSFIQFKNCNILKNPLEIRFEEPLSIVRNCMPTTETVNEVARTLAAVQKGMLKDKGAMNENLMQRIRFKCHMGYEKYIDSEKVQRLGDEIWDARADLKKTNRTPVLDSASRAPTTTSQVSAPESGPLVIHSQAPSTDSSFSKIICIALAILVSVGTAAVIVLYRDQLATNLHDLYDSLKKISWLH